MKPVNYCRNQTFGRKPAVAKIRDGRPGRMAELDGLRAIAILAPVRSDALVFFGATKGDPTLFVREDAVEADRLVADLEGWHNPVNVS